ncbi:uncharacterized protein LOC135161384 [Diachasmimorpha longicaudata]|uniref:uncharacterized protein LOC135161384 n=1 Tax=Diachasmimorpha longicaudata TaxID=58733 RepID=UPI0030B88CF0
MGNWQLEAAKMAAYIAFPVGLFHWFNQPENFSQYVEDVWKSRVTVFETHGKEQIAQFIEDYNREKDLQAIKAMEETLPK